MYSIAHTILYSSNVQYQKTNSYGKMTKQISKSQVKPVALWFQGKVHKIMAVFSAIK